MNGSMPYSAKASLALALIGCLSSSLALAATYHYRIPNKGIGSGAAAGGASLAFRDNVSNALLPSVSFPDTAVGSNSAAQVIKLVNEGSTAITFSGTPLVVAAPFSLSATTCAGTLAPAASCTASVVFSPAAAQAYSGSFLTVSSDATGVATPSFTGTGLASLTVTDIVVGGALTFVRKSDGTWWGAGENYYGGLGMGDSNPYNVFTRVPFLDGATQVVAGWYHTLAQRSDGSWWSTGYNFYGQLGVGDRGSRYSFTPLPALAGATQVVAGPYITFARLSNGTWVGTGGTGNDELGLNAAGYQTSFVPIPALAGATEVVPGADFTLARMSDGSWKAAGWNGYGEFGIGNFTSLPASGSGFITVPALAGLTKVRAGLSSGYALQSDGTVRTTGYNGNGELGAGNWTNRSSYGAVPGVSNVTDIVTNGYTHVFLRLSNGNWMAAGNADYNQLGLNDWAYHNSFVPVPALNGATKVIVGATHTFAKMANGRWYGVGGNDYGEMGQGSGVNNLDTFTEVQP